MSQTVRTSSSFSRSTDCTSVAKSSIVLRSLRSRVCAVIDMTRWFSTSQATVVGVRRATGPYSGQMRRAILAPATRVILGPALGDVVQQHGDVEHLAPLLQRGHQRMRQRMHLLAVAALDLGEHADAAQQVLVDRVVVVHRELHHRDDLAEIGDQLAEQPGLVHAPQIELGIAVGGQHVEEQPVGLGVAAQRRGRPASASGSAASARRDGIPARACRRTRTGAAD